jgi:hypothetical protein
MRSRWRTRAPQRRQCRGASKEIATLFGGLELAKPGRLVDVPQWHPDRCADPTTIRILARVAQTG